MQTLKTKPSNAKIAPNYLQKLSRFGRDKPMVYAHQKGRNLPGHHQSATDASYNPDWDKVKYRPYEAMIFGKEDKMAEQNRKNMTFQNVAPGAYNNDVSKIRPGGPEYTIARSRKNDTQKVDRLDVSPATYNRGNEFGTDVRNGVIPKAVQTTRHSTTPGPGLYSDGIDFVKTSVMKVTFTKARRRDKSAHELSTGDTVGPGAYDHSRLFTSQSQRTVGGVIGQGPKFAGRKDVSPGPNQYNPNLSSVKPSGVNIIMTRTAKVPREGSVGGGSIGSRSHSYEPGPGHYSARMNMVGQGGPSFQIPQSRRKDVISTSPGPGSHQPEKVMHRLPSALFGSSPAKRLDHLNPEDRPGPGSYEHPALFYSDKPGAFMSQQRGPTIQGKAKDSPKLLTPGPGLYDNWTPKQSRAVSGVIAKESRFKKGGNKDTTPGPGAYKAKKEFIDDIYANVTINKSGTARNSMIRKDTSPGPGHYDEDDKKVRHRSPNFFISTDAYNSMGKKLQEHSTIPGPGHYNNDSGRKSVQVFSF